MDSIRWTLLVNSLLFLAFAGMLVSGLVILLDRPFGMDRGGWLAAHVFSGLAFAALVGAHLWIYRAGILAIPRMMKR